MDKVFGSDRDTRGSGRCARASALTMALSTRVRGGVQEDAPSGVTTSFRPPRFLNSKGTRTVSFRAALVPLSKLAELREPTLTLIEQVGLR